MNQSEANETYFAARTTPAQWTPLCFFCRIILLYTDPWTQEQPAGGGGGWGEVRLGPGLQARIPRHLQGRHRQRGGGQEADNIKY